MSLSSPPPAIIDLLHLYGRVEQRQVDDRRRTVVDQVPGGPAVGLGFLPDGRLLVPAAQGRTRSTVEPDGTLRRHADLSPVTPHLVGDLTVGPAGHVYVGTVDFSHGPGKIPTQLLVVHPDGRLEVADDDLRFPNGMVLTPDGSILIVAQSHGHELTAYQVEPDGSLSGRHTWAPLPGVAPDGIDLDPDGSVWLADSASPRCLLVAEGGAVVREVEIPQTPYACVPAGDTLYVCASTFPTGPTSEMRPGTVYAHEV